MTRRRDEQIDERKREKERARLFADAADSTTGGGGLTAPLHIHPRYIDLSPSSGHRAAPRLTSPHLSSGEPVREPGASVPGAAGVRDSARLA